MIQITILSIVLFFLSCIIINKEVLAQPQIDIEVGVIVPEIMKLTLTDPRAQPQKYCNSDKCTPTMHTMPKGKFDLPGDIDDVHRAVMSDKPNSAIILTTRLSSLQRLEFSQAYSKQKMKSMQEQLKFKNPLKEAILSLMTPVPIFFANYIQKAIYVPGADSTAVVEVLCSVNNFGIKAIAEYYDILTKKPLVNEIEAHTPPAFQKVTMPWIKGMRAEGGKVDNAKAAADAKALNAGKPWPQTPIFVELFSTRSIAHLRQVLIEYKKVANQEVEDEIKRVFGPSDEGPLLGLCSCIRSKAKFLADRLDEGMKNSGLKMESSLIRIIIGRSDIDLEDIKKEYEKNYKKTLESEVTLKVPGDFGRVLVNMIKGNGVEAAPPGK